MNPELIFPMIAIIVLYLLFSRAIIPKAQELFVRLWLKIFNRKREK